MRNSLVILWFFFVIPILSFGADTLNLNDGGTDKVLPHMTSIEFDKWFKDERNRIELSNQAPQVLEKVLIERLDGNYAVSDSVIMSLTQAWRGYESPVLDTRTHQLTSVKYEHTFRILGILTERLSERLLVRSRLNQVKGEILVELGDDDGAVKAFESALRDLTSERDQAEIERMSTLVSLGDRELHRHHTAQSEKVYLEALSCDFAVYSTGSTQNALRDLYLQAGRGLIASRSGDVSALKDTYFIFATRSILQPELDRAIEAASNGKK